MNKQMLIIMLQLFLVFTGFGLIIPIMPEIVDEPFHLGLMLSVYSAVSFFMSPIWGTISDRIGRRPVIITGLIGYGISFFIFGIANDSLWMMYTSRILGGLFSGAAITSSVAYVADISSEVNRTKSMGFVGMSIGMGFVFGPPIGGFIGLIDLHLPFFISAGLSWILAVVAMNKLTESLSVEKRNIQEKAKVSKWSAFSGSVKYLYILSFYVTFALACLESVLQYYQVIRFGANTGQIGVMLLIMGLLGALIQGGVVRRIKKGEENKYLLFGLVFSAIGFYLLTFSSNFWNATLFLMVFGVGNALLRPVTTSLITQKTLVGQGVASGLNSSMDSLGRMIGPIIGTFLFSQKMDFPFIFCAILSILAIGLLYTFIKSDRNMQMKTNVR